MICEHELRLLDELAKGSVLHVLPHKLLNLSADLHTILLAEVLESSKNLIVNGHRNF